MKGVGLCLLVAAGCGIGCLRVTSLRGRVTALSTVLRFIDWWMREVRYTAAPLNVLLKRARADPLFDALLSNGGKASGFTEEDGAYFARFLEGLGATDLTGQLSHGAFYAKVFEERLGDAERAVTCRGRMEIMLWTGGAAVLALLLL